MARINSLAVSFEQIVLNDPMRHMEFGWVADQRDPRAIVTLAGVTDDSCMA